MTEAILATITSELQHAKDQRAEILELLRDVRGCVKQHSIDIAVSQEWAKGHERDVHGALKEDISALKKHNFTVSSILSMATSSISGAIAWILSK